MVPNILEKLQVRECIVAMWLCKHGDPLPLAKRVLEEGGKFMLVTPPSLQGSSNRLSLLRAKLFELEDDLHTCRPLGCGECNRRFGYCSCTLFQPQPLRGEGLKSSPRKPATSWQILI